DELAEEAPFQPPALDVHQMDDEPGRSPSGRDHGAGELLAGQAVELATHDASEVVQVVEQGAPHVRRLGWVRERRRAAHPPSTRRARSRWKRVDNSRSSTCTRSLALWYPASSTSVGVARKGLNP